MNFMLFSTYFSINVLFIFTYIECISFGIKLESKKGKNDVTLYAFISNQLVDQLKCLYLNMTS